MPLNVEIVTTEEDSGHSWCAVQPEDSEWLQYIARRYRELRSEPAHPIEDISLDGLTFDANYLRNYLAEAVLPTAGSGNFRVERSDFGETVSYCLLEQAYQTRFGYKGIRDRELIQLPGRGIDAVGVEGDESNLLLLVGETKTSADPNSPPSVVDDADDCLRVQHLDHITDVDTLRRKVLDAARRARDAQCQRLMLLAAMFLDFEPSRLSIVVCCCLVRQQSCFAESDYGTFHDAPEDYDPGRVRFIVFCVPQDIENAVDQFLEFASRPN